MSTTTNLLTVVQRSALSEFQRMGGAAFVNARRDGFEELSTRTALALIIAGVAVVEMGELKLTPLGRMLTGDGPGVPFTRQNSEG